jgi:signal transduction histidine kinase
MASAPSDPGPIVGRVDSSGRLVSADQQLERLQVDAGSRLGATLALPQLASAVRVAQRLQIPISRRVLAAGRDQDVDMWVRAVPDDEGVALSIESWTARPASGPRLAAVTATSEDRLSLEPLSWAVDEQLRLVSVSPRLSKLLSRDMPDIVGQPLTKLFRLEETQEGDIPLLDALASRRDFAGQQVRVREGKDQLVLSGSVTLDAAGEFAGFEGSATHAEGAAAADSSVELDAAIESALRSPLDRIVQSAESMREATGPETPDRYSAYAADIATAARHLLAVIHSLGEESESCSAGEIDLVELTTEAVALVESAAKERGISLALQPVEQLLARGEVRSVVQILVNLIGNAVRYSFENSMVTVSFERSGRSAFVHVADQGPGIDPADQDRIFEAYQKGSDAGEGSGLGLAIARRLARAMGGDVRLESAPGSGSRFTLVLPIA